MIILCKLNFVFFHKNSNKQEKEVGLVVPVMKTYIADQSIFHNFFHAGKLKNVERNFKVYYHF